jgi:hypothetical protein
MRATSLSLAALMAVLSLSSGCGEPRQDPNLVAIQVSEKYDTDHTFGVKVSGESDATKLVKVKWNLGAMSQNTVMGKSLWVQPGTRDDFVLNPSHYEIRESTDGFLILYHFPQPTKNGTSDATPKPAPIAPKEVTTVRLLWWDHHANKSNYHGSGSGPLPAAQYGQWRLVTGAIPSGSVSHVDYASRYTMPLTVAIPKIVSVTLAGIAARDERISIDPARLGLPAISGSLAKRLDDESWVIATIISEE